jgi:hypothetical protein
MMHLPTKSSLRMMSRLVDKVWERNYPKYKCNIVQPPPPTGTAGRKVAIGD